MLKESRRAAAKSPMALEEERSSAAQELRRAIDCLMSSAELRDVAPGILEMLAAGAVHFSLPAGDLLFASGTIPDGVYLVASGRMGVHTGSGERMVAEIERGEWVGESGWLLKEPRSATVVALRDTELLLLPDAVLDAAAAQSPQFSLAIAQLCARRLTRSNRAQAAAKRARVFALVPNSNEIDVADFATQLTAEFGRAGRAELVWDVRATTHTSAWFSRIEELNDYVVYVADPTESGWTRQCCRQADVVLCLAHARGEDGRGRAASPPPSPAARASSSRSCTRAPSPQAPRPNGSGSCPPCSIITSSTPATWVEWPAC